MPAIQNKPRKTSAFKHLMSVHWWMAACYLILFFTGPLMARLPRDFPGRNALYDFHKSIAVVSLILLVWRAITLLRVWGKKYLKRLPKTTPKWWQKTLLHLSLYILMVGVPLSGFLLSNSFQANGVKLFGLPVPDLFPPNRDMVDLGRTLHFWSAYGFLLFIGYHTYKQWHYVRATWRRWQGFLRQQSKAR